MLHMEYDITNLRGADYNPRYIGEDELNLLAESVQELGLVKPLIARGNLLVAGHQRTKALRKLGVHRAPVYVLPVDTTTYDEVRFNQLHNGTDMDSGDEAVTIEGGFNSLGYQVVEPDRITGNFRARMAAVRRQICQLIIKYGSWGGVVATESGKVIHCSQYALAAAMTSAPLTCYVIPDEQEDKYRLYLNKQYGEFSYDNLERHTYIQTFAQMMRLRKGKSGKENKSKLYESMVVPWLIKNKDAVGLDFGSGQGDYAMRLRSQGYQLDDVELFRRKGGSRVIDMRAVNRMIDQMINRLESYGQYDYVVLDSVMNSVDSLEAEQAVMDMVNALCKVGGTVFFSGRKTERVVDQLRMTKQESQSRNVEFLDKHGFTALYRNGKWFYQKYHDKAQVEKLCSRHLLDVVHHERNASSTSWQVTAKKKAKVPLKRALAAAEFEFNLPVGDSRTINRHHDVMKTVGDIYD